MNRYTKIASITLAAGFVSILSSAATAAIIDDVTVSASSHSVLAATAEHKALQHQRIANAWKSAQAGTRPPGHRSTVEHCERLAKSFRSEAAHHQQVAAASR